MPGGTSEARRAERVRDYQIEPDRARHRRAQTNRGALGIVAEHYRDHAANPARPIAGAARSPTRSAAGRGAATTPGRSACGCLRFALIPGITDREGELEAVAA